jgi:putative ABC transport system substrate-binding protein
MNKIFLVVACCALLLIWYFYPKNSPQEQKAIIGLVVPMEHAALDDIVRGFASELERLMGSNIVIEVQNALGDLNLQKSVINKYLSARVSLLVPVATGTTQMAINLASQEQPILFLAANISPDSQAAHAKPGLMGIIDEISPRKQLDFIRAVMPAIKKITLIFSSSDKMPDDAKIFSQAAELENINVQNLMIQNLAELYTVSAHIDENSQAIVILKDNLIASGIEALVQQANKRKIPLISSDQGTNAKGGAFALGVIESDIGRQGAQLAAAFLNQTEITKPIEYLSKISVFINTKACEVQGIDTNIIIKAAAMQHYEVIKK